MTPATRILPGGGAAPATAVRLRVLIVDDHPVVREGAALLLRAEPGIAIVGYAPSARDALAAVSATRPDVVLLDLRLPDMLAPEATRAIKARRPEAKVLLFTAHPDHAAIEAALAAGADGCLLKDVDRVTLAAALRDVAEGNPVVDDRLRDDGADLGLTAREYDVLRRAAMGETNPEIGAALGLARSTVKSYLQAAMHKLGARNRVEAIVRASEQGLL